MKNIMILCMVALFVSCSNDDDAASSKLPEATQTGENTFGVFINGNVLIPRSSSDDAWNEDRAVYFWAGYPVSTNYYELEITDKRSETSASLLLHMQAVHENGAGTYIIDESNGMSNVDGHLHTYLHCTIFDEATNSYQQYRSFADSGELIITRYDYDNRIISGTFSGFVRKATDPSIEIEIKDGRFDFKWDELGGLVFP